MTPARSAEIRLNIGVSLVIGVLLFVIISSAIGMVSEALSGVTAPANPDAHIVGTP